MDLMCLLDPFASAQIPLADWANDGMRCVTSNFRDVFRAMTVPVQILVDLIEDGLHGAPQTLIIVAQTLLAWQVAIRATGVITMLAMTAIRMTGASDATSSTGPSISTASTTATSLMRRSGNGSAIVIPTTATAVLRCLAWGKPGFVVQFSSSDIRHQQPFLFAHPTGDLFALFRFCGCGLCRKALTG